MARYNTAPVDSLKVDLIRRLLNDPVVNELWLKFVSMQNVATAKEREAIFQEYCHFRDKFLGLGPVVIPFVQGTNRGYIKRS